MSVLYRDLPKEERNTITDELTDQLSELLEHQVSDFKTSEELEGSKSIVTTYNYEAADDFLEFGTASELYKDATIEALCNLLTFLNYADKKVFALDLIPGNFKIRV